MLNYFNLDLHISVIADVKYMLKDRINIINWSLSGHSWILGRSTDNIKIITRSSWMTINLELIRRFQNYYDSFLSQFDGFIVAHPNVFVMLYEKYNKPIIMINSCRYDMPACFTKNSKIISELNSCILRLQSKGLLTIISNNLADQEYLRLSISEVKTRHIPSLCMYTGMVYSPIHKEFLMYSGEECIHQHPLIKKRSEIGKFNWIDIGKFRGVIHIPYEASTMSILEHISAGIPIFFPTKRFLKELWENKQAHFQCNYWGETPEYLTSTKSYDFWIDRADYYNINGYYYFDSFEDLFRILEVFEDEKKEERLNFIKSRTEYITNFWNNISLPNNTTNSIKNIQMRNFLLKLGL